MATKIYNDPWSPSNINCNWKPEKLSRYSFITNMIDFNAAGCQEGYGQSGASPREDSEMNLTAYIEVSPNTYYYFRCENGLTRGVRFVCFFTSNSGGFISNQTFSPSSNTSLKGSFRTPSNCHYIRITMYKQAWEKCTLRSRIANMTGEKDMTPLNIVDNKAGEKIYEDLHFEVYVKAEALIKEFVDCFNLDAFQRFPSEASYWYGVQNSLNFHVATKDYYGGAYTFNNFIANHEYAVGDLIIGYTYLYSAKYVCTKAHTSVDNFFDDYFDPQTLRLTGNWIELEVSGGNWLYRDKNIKEKNYSQELGFPYVGSLVFKNLWGCDMLNYLKTYVNQSYLAISYYSLFAKNLRFANSYYDKFFERGHFSDTASNGNTSELEGFGVRLLRGESFRSDDILGDTVLNNYFNWNENRHAINSDWNYNSDSVNQNYFGGAISNPFDHYYSFVPYIGIPFFKEKVFEDFIVELILEKTDVLGNLYQRIVDLPILVTFTNNLIKCYHRNPGLPSNMYSSEFLNSNSINRFSYNHTEGHSGVDGSVVVWCPNIQRLSVSSTISNPARVNQIPTIKNINGGDGLYGQVGLLSWSANELDVGETVSATHILECSDGENYDKFVFIQEITRNS